MDSLARALASTTAVSYIARLVAANSSMKVVGKGVSTTQYGELLWKSEVSMNCE